jgi:hypothetical protein
MTRSLWFFYLNWYPSALSETPQVEWPLPEPVNTALLCGVDNNRLIFITLIVARPHWVKL